MSSDRQPPSRVRTGCLNGDGRERAGSSSFRYSHIGIEAAHDLIHTAASPVAAKCFSTLAASRLAEPARAAVGFRAFAEACGLAGDRASALDGLRTADAEFLGAFGFRMVAWPASSGDLAADEAKASRSVKLSHALIEMLERPPVFAAKPSAIFDEAGMNWVSIAKAASCSERGHHLVLYSNDTRDRVAADFASLVMACRALVILLSRGEALRPARDLEAAQGRLATLQPAIASTAERIAEMTGRFGAGSLDDLALAFEASRRLEDVGRRIATLEIEIRGACGVASVAEADATLADQDRDELERRRAELETRCEDLQERTQERFSALERARHAIGAIDGDAAAARLEEERRTVLLEIEDRTMAHLTMRAGVIAAENAIGLYRDRHRSSMMAQASNLFATLSRGAYRGLAAQSHKDGEVLVGLPAGGGSKLSTELSTATRNQLYLALRIAAYREFVKTRRPVPFVLDDVLETFDDDRAEASLALLAEMAETGQVIYLTHHRHLCAIARRVCPSAKLHDLGALR